MTSFLPPDTARILPRIAARNLRRARRVAASLQPASSWERAALDALAAALSFPRGRDREPFLLDPGFRSWLCAAEEVIALRRARSRDRALFDVIARGSHLAEVVPAGRVDGRFTSRARALTRRLSRRVFLMLPPILAFRLPPGRRYGPFPLDPGPSAEESRIAGEIHVGWPIPLTLRVLPGARLEIEEEALRLTRAAGRDPVRRRETIGSSTIVLARRLTRSRDARRPGPRVAGLSARLSRALDLLARVWPEAHAEVLAHTRVVVPVFEPATVSWSQPDRPGISWIRIPGKSLVDLADDLLHETAHHRLHALEELGRLERDDGEPRYRSPWRRSLRPLRGILHAAYTFSYRAQLLARLARDRDGSPASRGRAGRHLASEKASLEQALSDLQDAGRRGLLAPAGSRLVREMVRRRPWAFAPRHSGV